MSTNYQTFKEFYPFYLSQHQNKACKILHFVGTFLAISTLLFSLISRQWEWLPLAPLFGYSLAWLGHFVFEKNKPATFQYPLYSLMGDFLMFWQIITKKLKI